MSINRKLFVGSTNEGKLLGNNIIICSDYDDLYDVIRSEKIEYINYSFCDTFGSLHHITVSSRTIKSGKDLEKGIAVDSSSVRGMKFDDFSSDVLVIPDTEDGWIDPFFTQKTLHLSCSVKYPSGETSRGCVRSIAKRAEEMLSRSGIADKCLVGPETELFIFETVSYSNSQNHSFFCLDGDEAYWNTGNDAIYHPHVRPNLGSRRQLKQNYCAPYPVDRDLSLRSEIFEKLEKIGIPVEKHHHEVATCQHEIGVHCSSLLRSADTLMSARYIIKGVAHKNNKTATFMPKPLSNDNGSGMHINISLWKNDENIFFDSDSSFHNLSDNALYFIGGILSHTKSIMAFTNPTTNSYKRLVNGYETPTKLSYAGGNRNSAIRIPISGSLDPKTQRIEFRVPDSSACPYLAFSAVLCAGIEGIQRKIHPHTLLNSFSNCNTNSNFNCNINSSDHKYCSKISELALPKSLSEALSFLENDHDYLIRDGVFSQEFIFNYIHIKRDEIKIIESVPTPKEFELYYD
ncbi:glutamate synthetase bacterial origin [Cryptosporidium xiaoi]|uniref:Lengsin n=1 Tax=Cryptosporidium xiaoi TaxID=659607 RepID=A0AAV9XWI7_9CRYT